MNFSHRWKWVALAAVAIVAMVAPSASAQVFQQAPAQQAPVYQQPYPPSGGGPEHYAPNLGVYYRLVPYNAYGGNYNPGTGNYDPANPPGGYGAAPRQAPVPTSSYGARLTRYPVANSAAAYLQLEPGDMIISLDNLAIYGPDDVRNHRFQTSMVFINIRTGQPQSAEVNLP